MTDSPELKVPEKCTHNCAVQCDLRSQMAKLETMKMVVEGLAENLVGESGQQFDALFEAFMAHELAETGLSEAEKQEVITTAGMVGRQDVSRTLDDLDDSIQNVQEESAAHELSCSGILRIRASKAGVTYVVNLCTSQHLYIRGSEKPNHVSMHVLATDAEQ